MKITGPIWFVAAVILATGLSANAGFTEVVDLYKVSDPYTPGEIIGWNHTYDHSSDPIVSATLTIVADDVDGGRNRHAGGEEDEVWLKDGTDIWHYLGLLDDMGFYTNYNYFPGVGNPVLEEMTSTTFTLDPSLIGDGFTIEVRVENYWEVEIETSTLNRTGYCDVTGRRCCIFEKAYQIKPMGFILKRYL